MNFKAMLEGAKGTLVKNSPILLTGVGIAGMIAAGVLACRATPQAKQRADAINQMKALGHDEKEIRHLYFTDVAALYVPAAIICVVSIGALVGGQVINCKRCGTYAAAASLAESALYEYSNKVITKLGKNTDDEIRKEIASDVMKRTPRPNTEYIVGYGENKQLYFDAFSGRYFYADHERMREIQNELNAKLLVENDISLNEFFYEVGLPQNDLGDNYVFTMEDGLIDFQTTSKMTEDHKSAIAVYYKVRLYKKY